MPRRRQAGAGCGQGSLTDACGCTHVLPQSAVVQPRPGARGVVCAAAAAARMHIGGEVGAAGAVQQVRQREAEGAVVQQLEAFAHGLVGGHHEVAGLGVVAVHVNNGVTQSQRSY